MVITPSGIDADHACRDTGKNRLGEAAAAIHQVARRGQAVVLAAQLRGHLVEGLAQMAEIALAAPHGHLNVEIAGRDLVGRMDQPADRRHEPVGEVQPEPDCRKQHDQRDEREHGREGDLDAGLLLLERLVEGDPRLRDRRELDRARIDLPGDVEDAPAMGIELQDGAEDVAARRGRGRAPPRYAGLLQVRLARAAGCPRPSSASIRSTTVPSGSTIMASGKPRKTAREFMNSRKSVAVGVDRGPWRG